MTLKQLKAKIESLEAAGLVWPDSEVRVWTWRIGPQHLDVNLFVTDTEAPGSPYLLIAQEGLMP